MQRIHSKEPAEAERKQGDWDINPLPQRGYETDTTIKALPLGSHIENPRNGLHRGQRMFHR